MKEPVGKVWNKLFIKRGDRVKWKLSYQSYWNYGTVVSLYPSLNIVVVQKDGAPVHLRLDRLIRVRRKK